MRHLKFDAEILHLLPPVALLLLLALPPPAPIEAAARPQSGTIIQIIPSPVAWVDIDTSDYDCTVQCDFQSLTVYWLEPKEFSNE